MKETNTIQFILDGKITTVRFDKDFPPTTTLLNYLRTLPGHKGVKEGCAEGDCGACTVVIAEPENGKMIYRAVNSCLVFMPMVHAKQVITVENLAENGHEEPVLHPVQSAIVEADGTQCGFCTPGIVMSLFALYKNVEKPLRDDVQESLAGNLCRCTGYQPVLNAGLRLPENKNDNFSEQEQTIMRLIDEIKSSYGSIEIDTGNRKYFKPSSIVEAIELLDKQPGAVIISGATDIALKQTKRFEEIPAVIDLSGIEAMKTITAENGYHIVGAGATLESVKEYFEDKIPLISNTLKVFASKQIRNIATLGGNLATASPISDTIPLLFALGAWITITGKKGERTCNMGNFIKGYRKTALQAGDLIKEIIIPIPDDNTLIDFFKVSKRKDVDISSVSAGISVTLDQGVIKKAVLAFGGMAAFVKRATETEKYLKDKKWGLEIIQEAVNILKKEFEPISDVRASAAYRREVAGNLLLKFFFENKGTE